ncbi:terpenoid synthase [Paxillus ammoniavirescens]|nr:terpenoid synthase [Paxillus ammoniavirescens]
MPGGVYRIPDLLALLPDKPGGDISPYFQEAKTGYNAWVNKTLGWFLAVEAYKAELPLLAALTCPLASCQELRAITNHLVSVLILEKRTDRSSTTDLVDISHLWVNTLRDNDPGTTSHYPFIQIMRRELVPAMKAVVDPFHWPQFITANELYAENIAREALVSEAHPNKHAASDVQSYMDMRRETIGTRPFFVLVRSIRRLYIPAHVLAHPLVEEMENVALEMIVIANDIYSFKKDYSHNRALKNLLTVILSDPTIACLDLQARICYAAKLFQVALDRFHACRENLPSFDDADLDRQVSSYADGLVDCVVGNIEWGAVTRRYNTFINETDRKNNIMRLHSRRHPISRRLVLILFFIVLSILFVYLPARSLYRIFYA